jgi:hypothetical protein
MEPRARAELFAETAARMGVADAIVEKDFWVCWTLKQLFSNWAFEGRLLFKGGTSLSKIYRAIIRFSEDIDLAVDYVALGFTGDNDPRQENISKTKRNAILDEMMKTCRGYIAGEFLETLRKQCVEVLGRQDGWRLEVSKVDPNAVQFEYPRASTKGLEYLNPQVVLELGTHAEFVPHDRFTIRSFAGEQFPNVVKDRDISVEVLLAKRTFWEKATILHAEYHRPAEKALPERYSRHYYDVAVMTEGVRHGAVILGRRLRRVNMIPAHDSSNRIEELFPWNVAAKAATRNLSQRVDLMRARTESDIVPKKVFAFRNEFEKVAMPRNSVRLIVVFLFVFAPAVPASAQSIVFTNVRIVDGYGGPPIEQGTIVVEGKKIAAVGLASQVSIPEGARVINGKGRTALPGLADMHVHLMGGWDGIAVDIIGYQRYLNALLYSGVTTVLDTGNVTELALQLRAETATGRLTGPRIYCVGPIIDGPDPAWPTISVAIASKAQIPGVIHKLALYKVDLVKLYVGLSDPLVRTISAEAKKQNLRTIIDQWSRNGSIDLAESGISGFAHFPSHRISDDAIASAKQHGVFFISTLVVQEAFARRRLENPTFLEDPLIADTTSMSSLSALRHEAARNLSSEEKENAKKNLAGLLEAESNVKRLRDAGILFAAGTDAMYPGDFQGEGLHRELELIVESGLTPLEAITTATKNAAAIMNATDEWGTLSPGKRADILLVDGKPDQKISDSRKITLVMQQGAVINRDRLKLDLHRDPDYQPVGL